MRLYKTMLVSGWDPPSPPGSLRNAAVSIDPQLSPPGPISAAQTINLPPSSLKAKKKRKQSAEMLQITKMNEFGAENMSKRAPIFEKNHNFQKGTPFKPVEALLGRVWLQKIFPYITSCWTPTSSVQIINQGHKGLKGHKGRSLFLGTNGDHFWSPSWHLQKMGPEPPALWVKVSGSIMVFRAISSKNLKHFKAFF